MRILWFVIWFVTLFNLFGCAAHPLRFSSDNSVAEIPARAVDESMPAGSVLRVASNPDSNLDIRTYYENGQPKMVLTRDRAAAYDAFGRQVTTIENNRYSNFESGFTAALRFASEQWLPRYDASVEYRRSLPPREPSESQLTLQAIRQLIFEELQRARAADGG